MLSGWSTMGPWRRLGMMAVIAVAAVAVTVALFWPITDLIATRDVGRIFRPIRARRLQMARRHFRGWRAAAHAQNFILPREGPLHHTSMPTPGSNAI